MLKKIVLFTCLLLSYALAYAQEENTTTAPPLPLPPELLLNPDIKPSALPPPPPISPCATMAKKIQWIDGTTIDLSQIKNQLANLPEKVKFEPKSAVKAVLDISDDNKTAILHCANTSNVYVSILSFSYTDINTQQEINTPPITITMPTRPESNTPPPPTE